MHLLRKTLQRIAEHLECRTISLNGDIYLQRYYVAGHMPPDLAAKWNGDRFPRERLGRLPTIYLHRFHRPDAGRDLHNHPWHGMGIVLVGGYEEIRLKWPWTEVRRTLRPGQMQAVSPGTFHRVDRLLGDSDVWTLFWVWDKTDETWGYWLRAQHRFATWKEVHGGDPNSHNVIDKETAAAFTEQFKDMADYLRGVHGTLLESGRVYAKFMGQRDRETSRLVVADVTEKGDQHIVKFVEGPMTYLCVFNPDGTMLHPASTFAKLGRIREAESAYRSYRLAEAGRKMHEEMLQAVSLGEVEKLVKEMFERYPEMRRWYDVDVDAE